MTSLLYAFAFVIGLLIPTQAAINNQLKGVIGGSTLIAALVSFSVGTITLAIISASTGQRWPTLTQLSRADVWMYAGGVLGATFVFGTTLLAPRIGVAAMVSLIIAGQVIVSLGFDRFGWLAMPLREVSTVRLAGALLLIVGVLLVNFGDRLFGR